MIVSAVRQMRGHRPIWSFDLERRRPIRCQRIRNRTIEALEVLASVPAGVVREGTIEWINGPL